MDSDTEFSRLSTRDLETISDYFKIEHEFMAPRSFYSLSSNCENRMQAVSIIAKVSENPRCFSFLFASPL